MAPHRWVVKDTGLGLKGGGCGGGGGRSWWFESLSVQIVTNSPSLLPPPPRPFPVSGWWSQWLVLWVTNTARSLLLQARKQTNKETKKQANKQAARGGGKQGTNVVLAGFCTDSNNSYRGRFSSLLLGPTLSLQDSVEIPLTVTVGDSGLCCGVPCCTCLERN